MIGTAAAKQAEFVYEIGERPDFTTEQPYLLNKYNMWVSHIYYRFDPARPFLPHQIVEGFMNELAWLIEKKVILAPRVQLRIGYAATVGGRPVPRWNGQTHSSMAAIHTTDISPAVVRPWLMKMIEKEAHYDVSEGIDYDPDWSAGDPMYENRLSTMSLDIIEFRVPGGGARSAGTGFTSHVLVDFSVAGDLCGQACLVYHAADTTTRNNMVRSDRPTAAFRKAQQLAEKIGITGRMAITDFDAYLKINPRARIIIYDEGKNILYDTGIRTIFPENIYLLLAGEHYSYIEKISSFMKIGRERVTWCGCCLELIRNIVFKTHSCAAERCPCCQTQFKDDISRASHMEALAIEQKCPDCKQIMTFTGCIEKHKCPYWVCNECRTAVSLAVKNHHKCGYTWCRICNVHEKIGAPPHRCFITPLAPRSTEDPVYWAYDIESTIDSEGKHAIAIMVVMSLYTRALHVLTGAADVVHWLDTQRNKKATLIAHNASNYDMPLLLQILYDRPGLKPHKLVLIGEKVISMRYGALRFIDSMRHIGGSLASLPETFGLPPGTHKGYFPYTFFTPENRWYVGPPPDKSYFPMAGKPDFEEWWGYLGTYDIAAECERYCINDVMILCTALEAYRSAAIELNGIDPFTKSTIASYAQVVYRANHMPLNSIPQLTRAEHDFVRPALQGGRTEAFMLARKWDAASVSSGVYGRYIDVNSMYPSVQKWDPLPGAITGFEPSVHITGPAAADFINAHCKTSLAVVVYSITPPSSLYIPVLLVTDTDSRLKGMLHPIVRATGTSIEIAEALRRGYTSLIIHGYMTFTARTDLFASYVDTYVAIKEKHSQGPLKNPGRCKIAKLMLNSLWGKFAQKDPKNEHRLITDTTHWFKLVTAYNDGGPTIDVLRMTDDYCFVSLGLPEGENLHLSTTNIALASFVTAHARLRLYSALSMCGTRALYCDTDSIVYETTPDDPLTPMLGPHLGEWKDETGGAPITSFVALAPKTWAYATASHEEVKCKGFPARWASVDMYMALLDGTKKNETISTVQFSRHCKASLGVSTRVVKKKLQWCYQKREIKPGYQTAPWGYKQSITVNELLELLGLE